MLVLTRKHQEQIHIGDNITISILKIRGNTVRLGIEAPRDVRVLRGELPSFESLGEIEIELPLDQVDEATARSSDGSEEDSAVSELEWEVLKKLVTRRRACLPVRRCQTHSGPSVAGSLASSTIGAERLQRAASE